MIDPGRLKTRLTIEAPVESDDGQGGVTLSYADGALQRLRITLRGKLALTLRHRLIDGTRSYRIVGFREIADRSLIEIDAELRVE
jgi:head-tail adaptor